MKDVENAIARSVIRERIQELKMSEMKERAEIQIDALEHILEKIGGIMKKGEKNDS